MSAFSAGASLADTRSARARRAPKSSAPTLGLVAFLIFLSAAASAALPPALRDYTDKYCSACHNDEDKTARLDLTSLTLDLTAQSDFATWIKVHDRLGAGEMPPKEKARPDPAETAAFLAALREVLITPKATRTRPRSPRRTRSQAPQWCPSHS